MKRFAALILIVAGLLALSWRQTVLSAQERETKGQESAESTQPVPLVIPEEEKSRKNPIAPNAESRDIGRKIFQSQCKMCHGEKGDGKGDLAQEMDLKVPDFTDPETQKKRTDGELFYILMQGHGEMPSQGKRLRDEQKWHLINYIRTLAPTGKGESEKKN